MSAEAVRLINTAISRCNGETITSVDEGTKEAILFDLNYEDMVQDELTGSSWKFARKDALLSVSTGDPIDTDWAYKLAMPDGCLMLRAVIKDGQPIEYQLDADEDGTEFILCNESEDVYAVFTYRASEDVWPPPFRAGVIKRCEEILLKSDERYGEAELRRKDADAKFTEARRRHAQEDRPKEQFTAPLIAARKIGNAPRRI
jgi:hypothetical protein